MDVMVEVAREHVDTRKREQELQDVGEYERERASGRSHEWRSISTIRVRWTLALELWSSGALERSDDSSVLLTSTFPPSCRYSSSDLKASEPIDHKLPHVHGVSEMTPCMCCNAMRVAMKYAMRNMYRAPSQVRPTWGTRTRRVASQRGYQVRSRRH